MATTILDQIRGISAATAMKAPCRMASTGNLGLSGLAPIDGVTPVPGDRVLAKDQTDPKQNGIWNAALTAWSRAVDFDDDRDVRRGTEVIVNEGTVSAGRRFRVSTADPVVFGSSPITFVLVPDVNAVSFSYGVVAVTASITLDTTAAGKVIRIDPTAGAVTVTLPPAATYGSIRPEISFLRVAGGTNAVVIDGNGSETVGDAATQSLPNQYDCIVIRSNGTAWDVVSARIGSPISVEPGGVAVNVADWDQLHTLGGSKAVRGDAAAANGLGLLLAGYYSHIDANNGYVIAGAPALGAVFHRHRLAGTWGAWWKSPRDGPQTSSLDGFGAGNFFTTFDQSATGAPAGLGNYTAVALIISPNAGAVRSQHVTICTGTAAGRQFRRYWNGSAWSAWTAEPVRVAATATGVPQLDLTIPAGFTRARLTAEITPATAGANMAARFSNDGGASFISTGTYSSFGQVLSHGSTVVSVLDNVTNGTSAKLTGAIDPAVVTVLTLEVGADTSAVLKGEAVYKANGASDRLRALAQGLLAAAGVNAIRLFASSGNFSVRYLWECFP